jgi:subtilisin family serine protease
MKKIGLLFCLALIMFNTNAQDVPQDWYHKDQSEGYMGVSAHKVYSEILKDKPGQTVVVAIIDSGIDIQHEDLVENLWVNEGEIPDNGIDDDNNGYIDDVHGWNFIGGPDGKNVGPDSYEATRLYAKYNYKYKNADPDKLSKEDKKEYEIYLKVKADVEKEIEKAESQIKEIEMVHVKVNEALDALATKLDTLELTSGNLDSLEDGGEQSLIMSKQIALQYLSNYPEMKTVADIKNQIGKDIDSDKENFRNKLEYAYNPDFDPRSTIVKDNYSDSNERYYGNNDVEGPDPLHGTHVAGIVGAVTGNGIGMDGIARNVKLMSVRTVPDGDERDKDVANAIRYAVDNGASIINMSFGKAYSWDKNVVDEAVKYAAKNDVLLVHAAGNSAKNTDFEDNFPNDQYEKKTGFICKKRKKAKNWIEVGALSYEQGEKSAARFSNYGKEQVDLFAPGMKIYSTMPNDEYAFLQGTSMASPVVAGIAAVLRSYYPTLTAEQVKEAIESSVVPLSDEVIIPGSKTDKMLFSEMSVTGGVANVYNAVLKASTMKGKKKIKKEDKKTGA